MLERRVKGLLIVQTNQVVLRRRAGISEFQCSAMIFEARSVLRRWITVTDLPNLVRNMASSSAESPPPTAWPA